MTTISIGDRSFQGSCELWGGGLGDECQSLHDVDVPDTANLGVPHLLTSREAAKNEGQLGHVFMFPPSTVLPFSCRPTNT